MKRLTCLSALALLAAGCGRGAIPAASASAPAPQPAERAEASARVVELRHFYLLTPGPNAKLVVTRSDLADAPQ
ncbi:MAG TPA: hypothetical protein VER04_14790 [Polyangiaceae bacterium]|nr:hypothetical protein [Polyangiaceae bacterium]